MAEQGFVAKMKALTTDLTQALGCENLKDHELHSPDPRL